MKHYTRSWKIRPSRRASHAALASAAVGIVSVIAFAGPASASTADSGCTLTPVTPAANGTFDSANRANIDYSVTVTCDPGRSVELDDQRWEKDFQASEGGDDMFGETTHTVNFLKATARKTKTWTYTGPLPSMDGSSDVYAELYHKVKFRVTSDNGVTGAWTAFESSPYRSIHQ